MSIAIKAQGLSKKYKIDVPNVGGTNFKEAITNVFTRKNVNLAQNSEDPRIFWALKDLNFEINEGDKVAIIGKNGAGKSTLLKLISRISEPSDGSLEIHGKVSSLLEVGTGFHPELTGQENIFLNGSILGMSRAEIKSKYNEIVEFSEIGQFISTPVKRYSSGMYVKLAFSVAAHLDPEILVLDEVLAVGDSAFQKKCFNKLNEITQRGITIIYVSHDLETVAKLTNKALFLKNGNLIFSGDTNRALELYNHSLS